MVESRQEHSYALGSDEAELDRLSLQGRMLAPATRAILAQAGIEPGMSVLDLGCGAGDVSLLAAELVGPTGRVTGVDSSPDAVARATQRAHRLETPNVRFVVGEIHDPTPGGPYDALTGRLVLMYVSDPSEILRVQATVLRSGALVVPIEIDVTTARVVPPTPLASQAIR